MIESEYYRKYKGPDLELAQIWKNNRYNTEKEDITEHIRKMYGKGNNWNGKLYNYNDIFPNKDHTYSFYIEFKCKQRRKHWFNGIINEDKYLILQ